MTITLIHHAAQRETTVLVDGALYTRSPEPDGPDGAHRTAAFWTALGVDVNLEIR